ncbi:MAG: ferritin [Chitinophagales bacterium]|nr:ferritin [Chitinophagales bacterium]
MISKRIEDALNKHLEYELEASLQYLAMASWCETQGMDGGASFFYGHAHEENLHFIKLFQYINEVNGHAIVPKVNQPNHEFEGIAEICEIAYNKEKEVSLAIYKLVELAKEEDDHVTSEMLRFYVTEQREEETLFQKVLDKIRLIGSGAQSLYYIDKELGGLAKPSPSLPADNA